MSRKGRRRETGCVWLAPAWFDAIRSHLCKASLWCVNQTLVWRWRDWHRCILLPLEFSFNTNFAQRLSFILERSSRSAQRHITKQIKVPREYAAHIPSPNEGAYQFKFCWARVFDQTNCRWEYFELEYLYRPNIWDIIKRTDFLRWNFKHGKSDTKTLLYKTFVRPVLDFASSIWDPHTGW